LIALIQRVSYACVDVEAGTLGRIDTGILALIGIQPDDNTRKIERMVQRLLSYRLFEDDDGRMNRSLRDINGGLLLIPQFTLAADTRKGTRPGFSRAAGPAQAEALFTELVAHARGAHRQVESGRFGADMSVSLTNQGPVTFWLEA